MKRIIIAATALLALTGTAAAQDAATARLADAKGKALGTVSLTQHPHGVIVRGELTDLPPGWHAIHIHAVGKCEPDFAAAGGHFNPGNAQHGLDANPMHAGDLPNIHADERGQARFEAISPLFTLSSGGTSLFDQDGASVVVHARPDDYAGEPAGNSGDRIACGVVSKG